MIWLIRSLRRDFVNWERPAQIAVVMAFGLLVVGLGLLFFGPEETRQGALIGVIGLLIVMQIAALWANRGMIKPFPNAQRLYLEEDFEGAKAILETIYAEGNADFRALTVLGNTYRQLGQLEDSHRLLYEALDKAPNHHFSLYGFGRTLLSEGSYAESAEVLQRALNAGAPPAIGVDLAEALYRAGQRDEALAVLRNINFDLLVEEPHRQFMAEYLLYRLNAGSPPDADLVYEELPYWEANAARFRQTQYGDDLAQDIREMRGRAE